MSTPDGSAAVPEALTERERDTVYGQLVTALAREPGSEFIRRLRISRTPVIDPHHVVNVLMPTITDAILGCASSVLDRVAPAGVPEPLACPVCEYYAPEFRAECHRCDGAGTVAAPVPADTLDEDRRPSHEEYVAELARLGLVEVPAPAPVLADTLDEHWPDCARDVFGANRCACEDAPAPAVPEATEDVILDGLSDLLCMAMPEHRASCSALAVQVLDYFAPWLRSSPAGEAR